MERDAVEGTPTLFSNHYALCVCVARDNSLVGNVAVYLLSGIVAQCVVAAWYEAVFIDKGDMPEGHVADDVMLYGCGLILLDAGDVGRKSMARLSQTPTTAQERLMYWMLVCIVQKRLFSS